MQKLNNFFGKITLNSLVLQNFLRITTVENDEMYPIKIIILIPNVFFTK